MEKKNLQKNSHLNSPRPLRLKLETGAVTIYIVQSTNTQTTSLNPVDYKATYELNKDIIDSMTFEENSYYLADLEQFEFTGYFFEQVDPVTLQINFDNTISVNDFATQLTLF